VPFCGTRRRSRGARGRAKRGALGACGRLLLGLLERDGWGGGGKVGGRTGGETALAEEADHGLPAGLEGAGCVHCGGWWVVGGEVK
jgi:hypothetical protein